MVVVVVAPSAVQPLGELHCHRRVRPGVTAKRQRGIGISPRASPWVYGCGTHKVRTGEQAVAATDGRKERDVP